MDGWDTAYSVAEKAVSSFNLVEGLFWLVVAAGFARAAVGAGARTPKVFAAASAVLALFGVSDFVEIHTGAWWRPWWLLVWKGLCLAILVALYVLWRKRGGRRSSGGSLAP